MKKIDKEDAIKLWDSIIVWGSDRDCLASEGNSGEFHDEEEEKRILKGLIKSTEDLIKEFHNSTGWKPVCTDCDYIKYKDEIIKIHTDEWELQ